MKIITGDSLEILKKATSNSVDAIVTDPPYGLSFMGKKWDYDVPSVEIWKECYRVLKPGGYLLSFAGTRTQHRMAVNIEDAGFEIRDMIAWVYGSGFPKSLNIGKVMDKFLKTGNASWNGTGDSSNGALGYAKLQHNQGYRPNDYSNAHQNKSEITEELAKQWEGWGTALKPSHEDITVAQKPYTNIGEYAIMVQRIIIDICQLPLLVSIVKKPLASNLSGSDEELSIAQWLADENTNTQVALSVLTDILLSELERSSNLNTVLLWLKVLDEALDLENRCTTEMKISLTTDLKTLSYLLSQHTQSTTTKDEINPNGEDISALPVNDIFNALKLKLKIIRELFVGESAMSSAGNKGLLPNLEPITVARKPLSEKNVAENVLKWGTGGINIDGSRVGTEDTRQITGGAPDNSGWGTKAGVIAGSELGRFPANLIHDGSDEVVSLFPNGHARGNKKTEVRKGGIFGSVWNEGEEKDGLSYDGGSAARFFYCAKASKADRDEGLNVQKQINPRPIGEAFGNGNAITDQSKSKGNNHPTVKPTKLMQYLVKLVTPKGGTVLDPFMGSGSTGKACKLEGFDFIGIEREPEYVEIAKARIGL